MRQVKLFIIAIFVLMVFLWLITLLLPSNITVSKSVLINAKDSDVAMQIENFKNWKNWYPAFQDKNLAVNESAGNDTVYAVLRTEDQNKLSIALIMPAPGTINILFPGAGMTKETYQFLLAPNGSEETNLTWNVNVSLGWYPWKKLAGIFLDKINGPEYEAALRNLKIAAEAAAR